MAAIELRSLTKRFDGGGPAAVDGLDLDVADGELLMLVGDSGSGKTTTLRMINRLIEPSSGRVRVGGLDVLDLPAPELRRRIGYVFQGVGLFPHLTVAQNVGVTPRLLGWTSDRVRQRVDAMLELVELDPARYRDRPPSALSGGQRQRVGVARALAAEPRIVLLDEPFGALDPATRERLQDRFQKIRTQLGFSAVFVTHDMAEALTMGDRIAVMRDGQLVQHGAPTQLSAGPADDLVRALLDTPRRQAHRLAEALGEGGPSR